MSERVAVLLAVMMNGDPCRRVVPGDRMLNLLRCRI